MIVVGIVAVLILLTIFETIGAAFNAIIRARQGLTVNILYGYMIYYSIFEVVYLICLVFNNNLNFLRIVWMITIGIVVAISVYIARKNIYMLAENIIIGIIEEWRLICVAGAVTLAFLLLYICGVTYIPEKSYAYSAISDSVYTGKMFLRDVYTGVSLDRPDITYALSGYYMHSAMLCSLFKMSAVVVQHNIMGVVCILMSIYIVYLIGRAIFNNLSKHIFGLIVCFEIINVYLLLYSNKQYFLLTGAYDEMTQLPYVLVPAILLGYIYILRKEENTAGWSLIALCAVASCSVSISSIVAVPLMILCGAVTVMIGRRDYRVVVKGVLCILPCIVYNVIYRICG